MADLEKLQTALNNAVTGYLQSTTQASRNAVLEAYKELRKQGVNWDAIHIQPGDNYGVLNGQTLLQLAACKSDSELMAALIEIEMKEKSDITSFVNDTGEGIWDKNALQYAAGFIPPQARDALDKTMVVDAVQSFRMLRFSQPVVGLLAQNGADPAPEIFGSTAAKAYFLQERILREALRDVNPNQSASDVELVRAKIHGAVRATFQAVHSRNDEENKALFEKADRLKTEFAKAVQDLTKAADSEKPQLGEALKTRYTALADFYENELKIPATKIYFTGLEEGVDKGSIGITPLIYAARHGAVYSVKETQPNGRTIEKFRNPLLEGENQRVKYSVSPDKESFIRQKGLGPWEDYDALRVALREEPHFAGSVPKGSIQPGHQRFVSDVILNVLIAAPDKQKGDINPKLGTEVHNYLTERLSHFAGRRPSIESDYTTFYGEVTRQFKSWGIVPRADIVNNPIGSMPGAGLPQPGPSRELPKQKPWSEMTMGERKEAESAVFKQLGQQYGEQIKNFNTAAQEYTRQTAGMESNTLPPSAQASDTSAEERSKLFLGAAKTLERVAGEYENQQTQRSGETAAAFEARKKKGVAVIREIQSAFAELGKVLEKGEPADEAGKQHVVGLVGKIEGLRIDIEKGARQREPGHYKDDSQRMGTLNIRVFNEIRGAQAEISNMGYANLSAPGAHQTAVDLASAAMKQQFEKLAPQITEQYRQAITTAVETGPILFQLGNAKQFTHMLQGVVNTQDEARKGIGNEVTRLNTALYEAIKAPKDPNAYNKAQEAAKALQEAFKKLESPVQDKLNKSSVGQYINYIIGSFPKLKTEPAPGEQKGVLNIDPQSLPKFAGSYNGDVPLRELFNTITSPPAREPQVRTPDSGTPGMSTA